MYTKLRTRILANALSALTLIFCSSAIASAQDDIQREARRVGAMRAVVFKLGIGKDSDVALTLQDGQRLVGFVAQSRDDFFMIGDFCTDQVTRIPYERVRRLRGVNTTTGIRASAGIGIMGRFRKMPDPSEGLPCGGVIVGAPADRGDEHMGNAGFLSGRNPVVDGFFTALLFLMLVSALHD